MSEFEKWFNQSCDEWVTAFNSSPDPNTGPTYYSAKAAWNHRQNTIDELKARIAELLDAAKDVSKNIRAQNEWGVMPLSRLDAAISKYEQQS